MSGIDYRVYNALVSQKKRQQKGAKANHAGFGPEDRERAQIQAAYRYAQAEADRRAQHGPVRIIMKDGKRV